MTTKRKYVYVDETVEAQRKYRCVCCEDILINPVQFPCTSRHSACGPCVDKLFRDQKGTISSCPSLQNDCWNMFTGIELEPDDLFVDHEFKRAMNDLLVKCSRCNKQVKAISSQAHRQFCDSEYELYYGSEAQSGLEYDPMTRNLYEKAMEEGEEVDKTIRVMVVGCYGQGKTTLVKRLLKQPLETAVQDSTNGIDIHKCIIAQDGANWESQSMENKQDDSMKRLASLAKPILIQSQVDDCRNIRAEIDGEFVSNSECDISGKSLQETESGVPQSNEKVTDISSKPQIDPAQFREFSSELKKRQFNKTDTSIEKIENVNLWDFGGQYVFYATHQLFHSRNAIYLLVFNLKDALETKIRDEDFPDKSGSKMKTMKDYIEFWVSSVHSFVGSEDGVDPPVILVGTHKDELSDEQTADDYFESVRQLFDGRKLLYHIQSETYPIALTDPSDNTVEELRKAITRIGENQATKHVIPAKWIPLEKSLKDIQNENIITLETVLQINNRNEYPIGSEDQVKLFLKHHHARGTFFYFDEGEVSDFVVVNPPYIIDAFKCIITSSKFCQKEPKLRPLWKKLSEKAILDPELLDRVWGNESNQRFMKFKEVLAFFLKKHRIIAEAHEYAEDDGKIQLTPLGYYIVPSLLSAYDNGAIEEFLHGKRCTHVSLSYVFENEAIIPTIFQRLTAAAIGTWPIVCFKGKDLLFEDTGAYKLDITHTGLMKHNKNRIELLVVQMCAEKRIVPEVPHYFRRFVELMIGQEFMKFNANELQNQERLPYTLAVKCFHEYHKSKGSEDTYDLKKLKCMKEMLICCPDNVGHESLCIASVLCTWYNQDFTRTVQKRVISKKEYSELSRAIGTEWRELGWHLGIDDITIQHIEMDNQRTVMRIYEMLLAWDKQEKEKATLDVLIGAVRQIPPKAVNWDIVNNIVDKFY